MKGAVILPVVIAILLLGTVSSSYALTLEAQISIGKPNGIDVDPSTNILYATSYTDSKVYVIDGNTNTIIDDISVGSNPHQVAFNPTTSRWKSNSSDTFQMIFSSVCKPINNYYSNE